MNKELSKEQIESLYKSGLSDESISKAGYTNETVFYNNQDRGATGIPYRNPIDGDFWFKRHRFDEAVQDSSGKLVRYHQHKGSKAKPYCSQLISDDGWQISAPNPSVSSIFTEGEKKADCIIQHQGENRLVVGLAGIYGWSKGDKELNDFISQHLAIPAREILLIFDNDLVSNTKIEIAMLTLAKALEERGCHSYIVTVPSNTSDPREKVGIDDYLVKFPEEERTEALEKLIQQKVRLTINKINNRLKEIKNLRTKDKLPNGYEERNNVNHKDPVFENTINKDTIAVILAKILDEEEEYVSELDGDKEVLYKYDKGIFNKLEPLYFRRDLTKRFIEAKTSQIRDKVYTELKDLVAEDNIPWCEGLTQWQIPLKGFIWDCFLDSPKKHDPQNYLRSAVNVDSYDPNEKVDTPNWDKFVDNVCKTSEGSFDKEKERLLHEIIGFSLTQRALLKFLLIFQGPRDTGKTLLQKILEDLIGDDFTSAFKIHKVDDNFGLEILPGKLLATDSEPKKGSSLKISGAILKQLTGGEEALYINAKNKAHVSKSITTKFLLLANTLPDIEDDSGVIFDRLIILSFENTVTKPDLQLHQKLKSEYKGIVHKAIKAFSDLAKRVEKGNSEIFTNPESSRRALEKYEAQNMPILKYCLQRIQKTGNPNDYISFKDLHADYCSFIEFNPIEGLKKLTLNAFARALSKTQYKTAERRPKKKGKRQRSSFSSEQSKNITALWGYKFIDQQE